MYNQVEEANSEASNDDIYKSLDKRYQLVNKNLFDDPSKSLDELCQIINDYCSIDDSPEKYSNRERFYRPIESICKLVKALDPPNYKPLIDSFQSFFNEEKDIRRKRIKSKKEGEETKEGEGKEGEEGEEGEKRKVKEEREDDIGEDIDDFTVQLMCSDDNEPDNDLLEMILDHYQTFASILKMHVDEIKEFVPKYSNKPVSLPILFALFVLVLSCYVYLRIHPLD